MAGPRRRAAVARVAQAAGAGLVVRAVPGGWTVAGRTGRTRVARTLGQLLDAVAPADRTTLRERALVAAGEAEPPM